MIKVRCPICQQVMQGQTQAEWPEFPFCSKRCKLIDLGRWLDGNYALPSQEDDDPPFDSSSNPSDSPP
ncbi:MAG: DNA gyrase inhibitor YacG [Gemmataceae bacterium]